MRFSRTSLGKLFDRQITRLRRSSGWIYGWHTVKSLSDMKGRVIDTVESWEYPKGGRFIPFVPVVSKKSRGYADLVSTVRSTSWNPFSRSERGVSDIHPYQVTDMVTVPDSSTYYLLGVRVYDLYHREYTQVFTREGGYQRPEDCCTAEEIIAVAIHGDLPSYAAIHGFGSECSRDKEGVNYASLDMNYQDEGPRLYSHHLSRSSFPLLTGFVPNCRERLATVGFGPKA